MKFLPVFVVAFLGLASAQNCPTGYYSGEAGAACNFACSEGCLGENFECDAVTGTCKDTPGTCNANWESSDSKNRCDVPLCFGKKNGCAEGGKCVAPNHCVCGESGAQIVAKKGKYPDENGQEGYNCVSLRKDGIWGAGLALIVITVSISICGGIERSLNKNKGV